MKKMMLSIDNMMHMNIINHFIAKLFVVYYDLSTLLFLIKIKKYGKILTWDGTVYIPNKLY